MSEAGTRFALAGEVLVVEDTPASLALLTEVLEGAGYTVRQAPNGDLALWSAEMQPPELVLLDVNLPDLSGFEVCTRLKADPKTARIPVIFLSALHETEDKVRGFRLGAVDYIAKPFQPEEVLVRVQTHITLARLQRAEEAEHQQAVNYAAHLAEEVRKATANIVARERETVLVLARAGEFRDNQTGGHLKRISSYSRIIARNLGLNEEVVELIDLASAMHDIGKIGIPDEILLKPGPLTPDEWKIMARHPMIGWEILSGNQSSLLNLAADIALCHHEKWDGTGYPNRLSGKDIPLAGRICALADVFDALTNQRPYKRAWSTDEAIRHIQADRSKHFDPDCIDAFLKDIDQVLEIHHRYFVG